MSNNYIHLRREIIARIIKAFFSNDFEKNIRLIPFDMRPKGAEVPFRCCIYKERAILKDRVIAGLGFAIEDDDETISLTEYAKKALAREELEKNPLTVLGAACKGCVPKRIYVTDLCQGCVARPCKTACKFGAIEIVNGKSTIDSSKCKACKMCISACPYNAIVKVAVPCEDNCPVSAIEKNEDGTAKIDFAKCISCGKCISSCPFGAVHEKSHLIEILKILKNKEEISLLFSPATAAQFCASINQLKNAIKKIGFTYVYEVAQGADITIKNESLEFEEKMFKGQSFMTTSCCAGYNELIKKHLPEMEKYKSSTKTPLFYTAEIAKKEHKNAKIVFVSPCVAKKQEAKENENVDYVLSIEELGAFFMALHIELSNCNENSDNINPSKQARNFAQIGGVSQAVKFNSDYDISPVVVNGLNKESIKQLKKYAINEECNEGNLIEVMCCEGGCIRGNSTIADSKSAKKILENLSSNSQDFTGKD